MGRAARIAQNVDTQTDLTPPKPRVTHPEQAALPLPQEAEPALPSGAAQALSHAHHAAATEPQRGAVFTRREVVDFILDLSGYTPDRHLPSKALLEPAFGEGDFLVPAVERLVASKERTGAPWEDLAGSICAVEANPAAYDTTRAKLRSLLRDRGAKAGTATRLVDGWLRRGDFLLMDLPAAFSNIVGNPPYVRPELVPGELLAEYRRRYRTMFSRADLYIAFIERGLSLLAPKGRLGFICANRWMKNKYGGPLRELVSRGFHLSHYVDMVGTPAFHREVCAYPAITVIRRARGGATRIARRPKIEARGLKALSKSLLARHPAKSPHTCEEIEGVAVGQEPWLLDNFDRLALVRRLERRLPSLEDAGCRVGIGVATGADRCFIGAFGEMDVEPGRKLPLAMAGDISSGQVRWGGKGVLNPFADSGALVDLADHPRLAAHLHAHAEAIRRRNVARRNPAQWYRTIDRIVPALAAQPKLLIPDIKGEAQIVLEEGRLYPHHNLYHITSAQWGLEALQGLLLGGLAKLFVAAYSTEMRGGFLRFQAQYLRRIRIPRWPDVPAGQRRALALAGRSGDRTACWKAAAKVLGLDREAAAILRDHLPGGG